MYTRRSRSLKDKIQSSDVIGLDLTPYAAVAADENITGSWSFTKPVNLSDALTLNFVNAGIEIGAQGTTNTPFIDFHSGATANDYDARILVSGAGSAASTMTVSTGTLDVQGQLVFTGASIRSGTGDGFVTINGGSASLPGYVGFSTEEGLRRAYIGWGSNSRVQWAMENGWGFEIIAAGSVAAPIKRGSYGSISVGGTTNSWAGIDFTDTNVTLMSSYPSFQTGMYANDTSWIWSFDGSGSLVIGTVPYSSVSGRPTTYQDIGSYVIATTTAINQPLSPGSDYLGSNLSPTGFGATSTTGLQAHTVSYSGTLAGTWRCMGYSAGDASENSATLFMRVA